MAQVCRLPHCVSDVRAEHGGSQAERKMRRNEAVATGKEHSSPHAIERKAYPDGSGAEYGCSHDTIDATYNGCGGRENEDKPALLESAPVKAHNLWGAQRDRYGNGRRGRSGQD